MKKKKKHNYENEPSMYFNLNGFIFWVD